MAGIEKLVGEFRADVDKATQAGGPLHACVLNQDIAGVCMRGCVCVCVWVRGGDGGGGESTYTESTYTPHSLASYHLTT